MKKILFFIAFFYFLIAGYSQSADDYFIDSANEYVNSKSDEALRIIGEGLEKYPDNPKLQALKQKIEEEKDQDNDKGEADRDGEESEEGKQESEENQSQQQSNQEDGRNRGEDGAGSSDQQPRTQEGSNDKEGNPKNGTDLQQQRYNQILESLKKQEQNTQRRLMMGENKSQLGRKQKDW
ncbi:hypothetical protein GO491_00615 [Flavobacteriaceae bacterium Ap0902]|nr:hypothetical protein [Flavobacteriaceae bacterium Ap0902]